MMYAVHEVFSTIQGEGVHSGTPAAFVRLMGCGVGCPWCDTKMTWTLDDSRVLPALPEGPRGPASTYALMTAEDLAQRACSCGQRHVVVTGGEPAEQDLADLATALHGWGAYVQLETSGTADLGDAALDWVTVSPKVGMPGGREVLRSAVDRASEVKWVVGKARDVDRLDAFLHDYEVNGEVAVCLQPLSMSEKAMRICVEACQRRGWRLSVQLHKVIGAP